MASATAWNGEECSLLRNVWLQLSEQWDEVGDRGRRNIMQSLIEHGDEFKFYLKCCRGNWKVSKKFRYCKTYSLWCTVLWILANAWSRVLISTVMKQDTSLYLKSLTLPICRKILPSLSTSDNHWYVSLPVVLPFTI